MSDESLESDNTLLLVLLAELSEDPLENELRPSDELSELGMAIF